MRAANVHRCFPPPPPLFTQPFVRTGISHPIPESGSLYHSLVQQLPLLLLLLAMLLLLMLMLLLMRMCGPRLELLRRLPACLFA